MSMTRALLLAAALLTLGTTSQARSPDRLTQARTLVQQGKRLEAAELLRAASDRTAEERYLLAQLLAEARKQHQVCEADAYRASIVEELRLATSASPSLAERARRDGRFTVVHDTVGWQRLMGLSPERTSDVAALLRRVTFHGPASGIFGNSAEIRFLPGGRWEGWRLVLDSQGDTPRHVVIRGSYQLKERGVTMQLGGREVWRGELRADGSLQVEGQGSFVDEPSECEA